MNFSDLFKDVPVLSIANILLSQLVFLVLVAESS